MASTLRVCRAAGASSSALRQAARRPSQRAGISTAVRALRPSLQQSTTTISARQTPTSPSSSFHTSSRRGAERADMPGGNPAATSLAQLDVLANTPAPSTAVDITMSSGFQLNNGTRVTDGSGVLLVSGEAFGWRPWDFSSSSPPTRSPKTNFRLLNKKGQFDIHPESLNLLAQIYPRPDILVMGLGQENRPLSPELRKAISAMGIRVEVLDTRNAAAQFNLLATERGVDDVAAALIPIGWVEGKGAGEGDEGDMTHE
ncbi:hypothetical protein TruAng_009172 [Truncatella angustata]|nr:hypothetical protein TruAng_009172 [Truncatella angustata]